MTHCRDFLTNLEMFVLSFRNSTHKHIKSGVFMLMHLSMSSWRDIGQGFDRSLWPGVGRLNYLAVPGVGIFEFFWAHDHKSFLGVGSFSYI